MRSAFESAYPIRSIILDTNWQILLVGEYQKYGISELVLVQHTLQFLSSLNNTVTIIAVNDEDDALGVLEVMPPQRSNLVLSTNIPYSELDVLVFNSLNVETWQARSQQEVRRRPGDGVSMVKSYQLWELL